MVRGAIVVALAAVVASCGTAPPSADAAAFMLCTDQMPLAPTFTNVQRVFASACTVCHTTGAQLVLTPAVSYDNLVGKTAPNYTDPPTDETCGGVLVQPGDPAHSYLYQKVSTDTPCAGSRMPRNDVGGSSPLVACEQQVMHDWIAAGAPNN